MASILLVEDNEMNRDMLCRRLQRRGFSVSLAVDGKEGLEKAKEEKPQVILLDIGLPVMDGWEAIEKLKQMDDTREIPVIALTAHAMVGDKERAIAAGFDDYDAKPVEFERLVSKIERLLADD